MLIDRHKEVKLDSLTSRSRLFGSSFCLSLRNKFSLVVVIEVERANAWKYTIFGEY